jgi:hypothetical protein
MGVQITVGGVWALSERETLSSLSSSPLGSKSFRDGLLYSSLLYVPSAVFFLIGWPGWNSMYLVDLESSVIVTAWYAFANAVVLFACYIAGFVLAARSLRGAGGASRPLLIRLAIMWVALVVLLFGLLWGRSFAVTTYQAFHAGDWPRFALRWGEPDSFFGHQLMLYLVVWAILDFAPLGALYWRARRKL